MMGQQAGVQDRLFYSFCLDTHVPPDHLLRRIDSVLDRSALRQHLAPFYSSTGRPSVDPELMIRMLIIGYCFGIRSERRLCEEVHLNLAYRWFCRLGLDDAVPEHSTFSKNRHGRFRASGAFRWLFDEVVRRCIAAGLVKGEGFAVDASVVAADANRQHVVPGSEAVDWEDSAPRSRAVREYLDALDGESPAPPKNISLTDRLARWTAAPGGPAFYAYSTNYLIDTGHGIILDVAARPAHRTAEVDSRRSDGVFQRNRPEPALGDRRRSTAVSIGRCNTLDAIAAEGVLPMTRRPRIYYSATQRAHIWERWRQGDTLHQIAKSLDRYHSSIHRIVAESGGIRPAERRRSRLALTLAEREEISRGIVEGRSVRTIATALGRAPSTVSREIRRSDGPKGYRASRADQAAWDRGCRPKVCKLVQNRKLAVISTTVVQRTEPVC
jgi:transposase